MHTSRPLFVVLVGLAVLLAGCSAPQEPGGESVAEADPVGTMTVRPGTTASMPILLSNASWAPADGAVSLADDGALDVAVPEAPLRAGDDGVALWASVTVPEDAASGTHEVVVAVEAPTGEIKHLGVNVEVDTPQDPLARDDVALVVLTVRTHEGAIAFTNDASLAQGPFPQAQGFQAPAQFDPIPFQLVASEQMPEALVTGLVGTGVGHSVSVDVPDAFGPEAFLGEEPRESVVDRELVEQRVLEAPRQLVEAQGIIGEDAEEGDPVELPGTGLPYVIGHLNETHVALVLEVQEGEDHTLHPAWPDGAEVVTVTESEVVLYLTPTVDEDEPFTWFDHWPGASRVVDADEDQVVVRHDPEPGTAYTRQDPQTGQPIETTVESVEDDRIVVSQANPHPLAGDTLVFEVTVADKQAPAAGGMPGAGPGP